MARVAFLIDSGFEDVEFQAPYDALRRAGHECRVLGLVPGHRLVGKHGSSRPHVQDAVDDADARRFDALVIPGGHSPARLCRCRAPVSLVRRFADYGLPIAAICTGPHLLAAADAVRGRKLTSWIAARPALSVAGACWQDAALVEDGALITSRRPCDLPSFIGALERRLAPRASAPG